MAGGRRGGCLWPHGIGRLRAAGRQTTTQDYAAKVAGGPRAAKDEMFLTAQRSDPEEPARPNCCRWRTFPSIPTTASRRALEAEQTTGRSSRCRRRRAPAQDAARRHARVLAQGPAAEADGVRRARRRNLDHLFVPFSDLTSGTETYPAGRYHRSRSQRHRHLRARLQPRVSPVLLLQPTATSARIRRGKPLKIPIRAGERMKEVTCCAPSSSTSTASSPTASRCTIRAFRDVLAGARRRADRDRTTTAGTSGSTTWACSRRWRADQRPAWTASESPALVDRDKASRIEELERDASVLFPGADDAIRRAAAAVPIAIASGALGAEIRRVLDARAA